MFSRFKGYILPMAITAILLGGIWIMFFSHTGSHSVGEPIVQVKLPENFLNQLHRVKKSSKRTVRPVTANMRAVATMDRPWYMEFMSLIIIATNHFSGQQKTVFAHTTGHLEICPR